MTTNVLSESAFDSIVLALSSIHNRAALYRHNTFLMIELTKAKAELEKALQAAVEAENNAKAAHELAAKAAVCHNEDGIRADERQRVADTIERHSVGDTVRAKNGQKIAHMIRSGEWQ